MAIPPTTCNQQKNKEKQLFTGIKQHEIKENMATIHVAGI